MSHDPGQLGTEAIAGAFLTGNYALGKYKVLVIARIIDNRYAAVLASVSAIIPVKLSKTSACRKKFG
ncbi:MAG: FlgO family outer membrane protein [Deltaproteobacteria bacterium]